MNLLSEFRKYIFNIFIVNIYLLLLSNNSISRHKTLKKGVRSGKYEVVGRGGTNW